MIVCWRTAARVAMMASALAVVVPARSAPAEPADPRVAARLMTVTRATVWTQVAAIRLPFRTFHPQGMVRIGTHFYLSAVEIRVRPRKLATPVDGHAYDAGEGVGHLFKFDADGHLLGDLILGKGTIYHPGGIDYDGRSIWIPVAEYRPDSRASLYRIAPDTMTATLVLTVDDHIGALVHDIGGRAIVGLSWGARRLYRWPIDGKGRLGRAGLAAANPQNDLDYQDCHYAGGRTMICAGVADYRMPKTDSVFPLGGIDLFDLAGGGPVWQVPVALWSPSGRAMTQNPFWLEATATGLRAWFIPDDDVSTLYAFETPTP